MKNKKSSKKNKIFLFFILGGLILKLLSLIFGKRKKLEDIENNFKDFVNEEKKEIEELKTGKENIGKYCRDSLRLFKNYFVPSESNEHKPKILQHKSLAIIVIALVAIKLSVTGYLYFIYPNQAEMSEEITSKVLALTNQDRISNNLKPLTLNTALSASAHAKAEDMAINNYFAHYSLNGKRPWDWIDRNNYAYLFVGENLAINFTSAQVAHEALMNSSAHRRNILNERYHDVGLAVISGEINGKRTNILVELFAVRQAPKIAVNTEPALIAGATDQTVEVSEDLETEVLSSENNFEKQAQISEKLVDETQTAGKVEPENLVEEKIFPGVSLTDEINGNKEASPRIIMYGEGKKINNPEKIVVAEEAPKEEIIFFDQKLNAQFNENITYFAPTKAHSGGTVAKLILFSKYIYMTILILLIIALGANIFIRVGVQHKSIIAQTIFAIIFIAGLFAVKIHIIEQISGKVALL
ncbi:MAG: CAP domain-containing protein [Patescibacteria group bacterium]|nr:CAP domain-containing protein [Patescibacteria group bacterium]